MGKAGVGEVVFGDGDVENGGEEAEEETGDNNEKVETWEEVGGAGGGEFCEDKEGEGELEGKEGNDDYA